MGLLRRHETVGRNEGRIPTPGEIEAWAIPAPEPQLKDEIRSYNLYRKLGGRPLLEYAEGLLQKLEQSPAEAEPLQAE